MNNPKKYLLKWKDSNEKMKIMKKMNNISQIFENINIVLKSSLDIIFQTNYTLNIKK